MQGTRVLVVDWMKGGVVWKVHCRGVHISANIKIEIQQSEETSQAALVNFHVHQLVSLAYITLVGSPDPFHILLLKCVRLKLQIQAFWCIHTVENLEKDRNQNNWITGNCVEAFTLHLNWYGAGIY